MPLTVLLRAARRTVSNLVRQALDGAGYSDLPPNGPFVLSALLDGQGQLGDIIGRLGVTKQAASQLVESLVGRGYLERATDPSDRRRLVLALTVKGEQAGAAVRLAAGKLEAKIAQVVGLEKLLIAKEVMATVMDIGGASA